MRAGSAVSDEASQHATEATPPGHKAKFELAHHPQERASVLPTSGDVEYEHFAGMRAARRHNNAAIFNYFDYFDLEN